MHTLRNRILFFGTAMAAGLASLGLHQYMLENCIDHKGLLMAGNLPGKLLWVVGAAFVAVLICLLRTIGGDGTYADNFPRCLLSGSLLLAAGGAMAWAVPELVLEIQAPVSLFQQIANLGQRYLPWIAAASMAVLGIFRMAGKRPPCIFAGVICLYYIVMLVNNYRLWSADPQLYSYAYQLLAGVLLMLCSFHRTCCDAEIIQRKKLIATGLTASVCCLAALSGEFQWGFYLASGLWAAGCICNVAQLPPDPEEEETPAGEETPAE